MFAVKYCTRLKYTSARSCLMESYGGRWEGGGGFSSSLSSSEEKTRIWIEDGIEAKDGLQDEDDTRIELGL